MCCNGNKVMNLLVSNFIILLFIYVKVLYSLKTNLLTNYTIPKIKNANFKTVVSKIIATNYYFLLRYNLFKTIINSGFLVPKPIKHNSLLLPLSHYKKT